MDAKDILKIFEETAYVRMGGSEAELRTAKYLQEQCARMGLDAQIEEFDVDMATIRKAVLTVDGKEIPCKAIFVAEVGKWKRHFTICVQQILTAFLCAGVKS